jgi:mannose/fructose/N-acetylgalactosamine-specific phosphotransferase system component IIB
MITLVRIDDRLIHGQVALLWVNLTQAETIVVVNDKYANNAMLSMSLSLAKPPGVDLKVYTVEQAIANLTGDSANRRVFIVVGNTKDALTLTQNCSEIQTINLGGVRSSADRKKIGMQLFLDEQDIENIKQMHDLDKDIYLQAKPDEKKVSYAEVISLWEKS